MRTNRSSTYSILQQNLRENRSSLRIRAFLPVPRQRVKRAQKKVPQAVPSKNPAREPVDLPGHLHRGPCERSAEVKAGPPANYQGELRMNRIAHWVTVVHGVLGTRYHKCDPMVLVNICKACQVKVAMNHAVSQLENGRMKLGVSVVVFVVERKEDRLVRI